MHMRRRIHLSRTSRLYPDDQRWSHVLEIASFCTFN